MRRLEIFRSGRRAVGQGTSPSSRKGPKNIWPGSTALKARRPSTERIFELATMRIGTSIPSDSSFRSIASKRRNCQLMYSGDGGFG
ncbi:MAG TPA: hypothetical protein VEC75_05440, partial [Stellaceae bacterium]|nr:hypothetical protein [Stellaceae bacterium]